MQNARTVDQENGIKKMDDVDKVTEAEWKLAGLCTHCGLKGDACFYWRQKLSDYIAYEKEQGISSHVTFADSYYLLSEEEKAKCHYEFIVELIDKHGPDYEG